MSSSASIGLQGGTVFTFTALANDTNGDPLSYSWDFGDQSSGTGSAPSHVYLQSGTFTVTVTVGNGSTTAIGETRVTVKNLSGLWVKQPVVQSPTCNLETHLTLAQTGTSLTGTIVLIPRSACPGVSTGSPATVTGTVSTASPPISWSSMPAFGAAPRYTAQVNQDITALNDVRGCSTNPVTQVETCNPVTNLLEPLIRQ